MGLAGRAGNVYVATQLIEDCEDDWDVDGGATATSANTDTDRKVGDKSIKVVVPIGSTNGDILAHEVVTSMNLTTHTHLMYWVKSDTAITTAGDLQIGISETEHLGGSPQFTDVPVLGTDWKYCFTSITTTGMDTVISVGLKLTANDPDAFNILIDDIRAAKIVAGVKSWTLDYTVDMLDTTDFIAGAATNAARTFLPGLSTWSGSFESVKDAAPLSVFTVTGIELKESASATQSWLGNVIITGIHPSVASDGLVMYAYDFEGTGELTPASS